MFFGICVSLKWCSLGLWNMVFVGLFSVWLWVFMFGMVWWKVLRLVNCVW